MGMVASGFPHLEQWLGGGVCLPAEPNETPKKGTS